VPPTSFMPLVSYYSFSFSNITEFILEINRYYFLKVIPISEVKYRSILSGISYHCKIRIRKSADIQKVKYQPIISMDQYIGRSQSYCYKGVLNSPKLKSVPKPKRWLVRWTWL